MRTGGYEKALDKIRKEGRFRQIPEDVEPGEQDLSSNDYMGLGNRYFDEYADDMIEIADENSMSASASRLLCGNQNSFKSLEKMLEKAYGRPALLFNSGYHANTGVISALAIPSTLFVADRLVHASIIDGLAIGRAEFKRFPHNDTAKLRRIIEAEANSYERIIIVTESLFSMGGDESPLEEISRIRDEKENILLYVDEAHAFGVRGKRGLGILEEKGLLKKCDFVIGTFGKACASAGAFCVTSPLMKEFLINASRSFIFSTALPPAVVTWSRFMFNQLMGMEKERKEFAETCRWFNLEVEKITGRDTGSRSQIVPLKAGGPELAVEMSRKLRAGGFIGLPIRKPTVPAGEEMVRISLRADLEKSELEKLLKTIKRISE